MHRIIIENKSYLLTRFLDLFIRKYYVAHGSSRGNPQEPDYVLNLVYHLPQDLYTILTALAPHHAMSVNVYSVFCHQSPKVREIGARNSCELGDLLICHFHTKRDGNVIRRAKLLQAKRVDDYSTNLTQSGDITQLRLYAQWPEFEYCYSGQRLNGQRRNVYPKQHRNGAQYLLIKDGYMLLHPFFDPYLDTITSPFQVAIAQNPLIAYQSLEDSVYDLLALHGGDPFDDYSTINDDWSRIVWDLLINSLNKGFRRRRSGIDDGPVRIWGSDSSALDGIMHFRTNRGEDSDTSIVGTSPSMPDSLKSITHILLEDGEVEKLPNDIKDGSGVSVVIIETIDEDK